MEKFIENFDSESLLVTGDGIAGMSQADFISNLKVKDYKAFLNQPLYKFYSMRALAPLLTNEQLYIDRVNSWEDVYENFFLKEQFYSKSLGVTIDTSQYSNDIFGQSWTSIPETDAMWRIYSSDKLGVRIETSTKKLFTAVFVDYMCLGNTWLGEVMYETQEKINDFIIDYARKDKDRIFHDLLPITHFFKRKEFDHEHEIRLIKTIDGDSEKLVNSIKRLAFKIDINDFIESYLLDPRLDDVTFQRQKELLISFGADSGKISRSPLYEFTPIRIEVN